MNVNGIVEDGSQRSFFPNGFAIYIYAEALMNRDCDFEAVRDDYFAHIYGEDWKDALSLLSRISTAFDYEFTSGRKSKKPEASKFYNPDMLPLLESVKELANEERALVAKHMAMPTRPQTVCWRLLLRHAEYVQGVAEIITELCQGHYKYAMELFEKFRIDFGKYSYETERYFDYAPAMTSLRRLLTPPKKAVPAVADADV
jgi:hypothetical protein